MSVGLQYTTTPQQLRAVLAWWPTIHKRFGQSQLSNDATQMLRLICYTYSKLQYAAKLLVNYTRLTKSYTHRLVTAWYTASTIRALQYCLMGRVQ